MSKIKTKEYTPLGSRTSSEGIIKILFGSNNFTILESIVELYHNSDDANAENIKIFFEKYDKKNYLIISDDGDGMNMEDLDKYLELLGIYEKNSRHGKYSFGGKQAILYLNGIFQENYGERSIIISKK